MPGPDLRLAHFVAVPPASVARMRRDPSAATGLRDGTREEASLGHYWHGVQYLLAGRATGVRGPAAWLASGGDELSATPGGPVRYLSPDKVRKLAALFADTEPDDLGDDVYDEAAMDAAGVHPGRWTRRGETFDQLGTMRELYSYVRRFMARQAEAGNGVAIVMTLEPAPDDEAEETPAVAPPAPPVQPAEPAAPSSQGAVLLAGAKGRRYERAEGKPQEALDRTFAALGYRPLGDMAILPVLAGGVVRTYRADDGMAVAACIIGPERVASTTFLALLGKDTVLVVSDAFVLEKVKKRVFATMMSRGTAAELDATMRERRATLEKKHGAAVVMPPELVSAAKAWEAWWAKQAG